MCRHPAKECITPSLSKSTFKRAWPCPHTCANIRSQSLGSAMLCSANCEHSNNNSHAISWHECPTPKFGSTWEHKHACIRHRKRPTLRNNRCRCSDPGGTLKITNWEFCSTSGIAAGKRKKNQADPRMTTRRSEAHLTVQQSRRLIQAGVCSLHSSPCSRLVFDLFSTHCARTTSTGMSRVALVGWHA